MKMLEDLLKGKSIIRGGGGSLDSLTEISAARINENIRGIEGILGFWKLQSIKSGEYFYTFTPKSGKQKIIFKQKDNDEQFAYLTFNNYKNL